MQAEQDAAIQKAVGSSSVLHIRNHEDTLASCLAYRVPPSSNLGSLRSQLGNALAEESARRGMEAVGMVAYVEVIFSQSSAFHSKSGASKLSFSFACSLHFRLRIALLGP